MLVPTNLTAQTPHRGGWQKLPQGRHAAVVLAVTTLSGASLAALQPAAAWAQRLRAKLYVLHLVDLKRRSNRLFPQPHLAEVCEHHLPNQFLQEKVRQWVGTMTGQWLPREQILVAEGNAIDEIVAAAIKLDADLIVMGLSRAGELGPRVGLTANRISTVVCRSRKVVLVARPNAATTHILAASDFTDAEYPALHYASLLADWLDVELTFLHHVNPSQASFTALSCAALLQSRPPDLTCLRSQAARARIDRLAAHFGTGIETVVTEGDDTAGKILAEAAIRKADILVVGAHGTSFIQRWLYHPVGIELIEQATVSVFVVPLSKTRTS